MEHTVSPLLRILDKDEDPSFDAFLYIGETLVLKAHKNILSMTIPFFERSFQSGMKEAETGEVKFPEKKVSKDTLRTLVRSVYGEKLVIDETNARDIHATANFLEMDEISDKCVKFMRENLKVDTVLPLWEYSLTDFAGSKKLLKGCEEFIAGHFLYLYKNENFLNLDVDFLCAFLSLNTLCVSSENDVFDALLCWLNHDWGNRFHLINERSLLDLVRWESIDLSVHKLSSLQHVRDNGHSSVAEKDALFVIYEKVIGLPERAKEPLTRVKASKSPGSSPLQSFHGVAGIASDSDCKIVLSTFDDVTHNVVKEETVAIPPGMRVEGMQLCDMCSFDSRLYMLAVVRSASVFVLYEYDHKSGVFQYAVLRPPPGRGTFANPQSTRVFLDSTSVVITTEWHGHNDIAVYYMGREELVFSQHPLVDVDGVASCQLLAVDAPAPGYARAVSSSKLAFDDVAGRLYYSCSGCCMPYECSNLVFYLDLQSKAFVRCPDCPLELGRQAATVHEGSLLVAGGGMENGRLSPKVWRLDKDGSNWVDLPSMNMGHAYGSLLVNDGRLHHFDTDMHNEQVGLETLDLMNIQDGWKMNENSEGMFRRSMRTVRAFLS